MNPISPLYLSGQTGSGKTAVALSLARKLRPAEMINADAFQIYSGMEIVSAAPTGDELDQCPAHLFAEIAHIESCDAARFANLAENKIAEVGEKALPLVVGGSGLYLKAITHGLAPTPASDPETRAQLDALSFEELVARYRRLDPIGADATNLLNRRYVSRNLEICILTGRPSSELKSEWQRNAPKINAVFLQRSREDIYRRINHRTIAMFENGVVEEVAGLDDLSQTAEKAIGVREIRALLRGEIDEPTCIELIQQATRRYAKRQESWFKRENEFLKVHLREGETSDEIADRIIKLSAVKKKMSATED